MNLSYWEINSWFKNVDFCVVGSGIVGLSCALSLRKKHPNAKILVLEKGMLPEGASTKNAGFACFGSLSEIISDLKNHSEQEVINLIKKRIEGLKLLRQTLGDKNLDFKPYGGNEIFTSNDEALFNACESQINDVNTLLFSIYNKNIFSLEKNNFPFKRTLPFFFHNSFEGQIDTGAMMLNFNRKAISERIIIVNNIEVKSYLENHSFVEINTSKVQFKANHLFIATNAFANKLLNIDVVPVRNQVLITSPIKNLNFKGTFHIDRGYFYFRNIHNRILIGGGRHLDSENETTSDFGLTDKIQEKIEELLQKTIIPTHKYQVENRWSGILGVGTKKYPVVKSISSRIHCGVRLGGMGVAVGSIAGKELSDCI